MVSNGFMLRRRVVAATILLFGLTMAVFFLVRDPEIRFYLSDILSPILNILATLSLTFAGWASRKISKRLSVGWWFLAAAQLSFTIGDILWAVFEIILHQPPSTSVVDIFYLLYYPLLFAGILIFPLSRLSAMELIKRFLDISIVLISSILGFWIFLIEPLALSLVGNTIWDQLIALAYPVGDLVMLSAVLILLYNRTEMHRYNSILILSLGIISMIYSDIMYSYQSLAGTYQSGGLIDLGWLVSYLFFALAGALQVIAVREYRKDATLPWKTVTKRERISIALSYLPYGWVVMSYTTLQLNNSGSGNNPTYISVGVGVIIGLVLLRQIIALNENRRLVNNFQLALEQVKHQAMDLEKTNDELKLEIVERERMEQQLSYHSLHDHLTGLANRALFMDRLDHKILELSTRDMMFDDTVMFIDLDNFKNINDSLGHSTGDTVLIEIAQRVKKCTRTIDTVARFGGDEFVVLLEGNSDETNVGHVADRIQREIQRAIVINNQLVYVSCSIGIVKGVETYHSSEEVIRDADTAMYRAKVAGKARKTFFDPTMRDEAVSRLVIENDLRRAVNNQEFVLYYQPVYQLGEVNKIEAFEALIRWQHPIKGLLLPAEFINVAEESGLILEIGEWVLLAACKQLKTWLTKYPQYQGISVNVNISGKQLNQIGFVDVVKRAIVESGLEPTQLKLEITENYFIENCDKVMKTIMELNEIGVQFLIDDFGTGYSSLDYVRRFPVKTIKIDRAFVQDIVFSKKDHDLLQSIISMAHSLGINTVVEGIENEGQLSLIKSMFCKYGQGFLFSRSVNACDSEKLFNLG